MLHRFKTTFCIGTLFCTALLAGCTHWQSGTIFRRGLSEYRGDGSIRDVSQRSVIMPSRGYVIELEKFNLGSNYEKQFRIANLPMIPNKQIGIYLAVERKTEIPLKIASDGVSRKDSEAKLTITLQDSAGATVTAFSTKVADMIWSSPVQGHPGHWTYDEKASFFTIRPAETYVLRVQYSPDAVFQGTTGCIYLYSGSGGS